MPQEITVFHTPIGVCALVESDGVLQAVTIGHRSDRDAVKSLARRVAAAEQVWGDSPLAGRIVSALEGEADDFRDIEIDTQYLTPFGRRVMQACRKIGWGKTRSYGQLAAAAGRPGAARAVGSVMAANRTALVVPCHRVVASDGGLGGYSAPQGLRLKRRLLDIEAGKSTGQTRKLSVVLG